MRGGGGASGLAFRGVVEEEEEEAVVSASERPMQRRRRRWETEVDDGYSPSSTGGGGSSCCDSFGCDSPFAGFVRPDGDPDTDLETDGLATSSSSAFTERQDDEAEEVLCGLKEEEWAQVQEPAKNPAGRATPECHNQRYRTEAAVLLHGRKGSKQRPASLDLGSPGFHGATFSPSFVIGGVGLMNKGLGASLIRSDVFHSPGTPNYPQHRASVLGCQKGWSSERVPHPSKGSRRYPGSTSSMAFPYSNGRTLPSKWEDAERWIFSPNSSDALGRTTVAHARRPKSKSGPLGPPGRLGGQYSSVSSVSLLDSGRAGPITANSPFAAGVLMPEHVCGGKNTNGTYSGRPIGDEINIGRGVKICPLNGGSHPIRTSRVRRRLDSAVESSASLPSTQESIQDEQVEITEDSASTIASIISRKDAATQTSPEELSRSSSPNTRPTFNRSLSTEQVKESGSCFSDLDIRDVQMDDRVTLTRWSKKNVTRSSNKNSTNIIEWKEKTVESNSSSWGFAEAKCISKIDREDTKITAWENIQKAKAEAAIQKLVIKLEKKRSSSLDKILNTLKSAQRKAQVMREREHDAVTANQDGKGSRKANRRAQLSKNGQISSLSGCFTCHAF